MEFAEALNWYAERSLPAARAFDEAVSQALREIEQAPLRWPLVDKRHRIKLLAKYPYHIIYRVEDNELIVLALAHHRRKPKYWRGRGNS
jgi:plasmid stabilization system protein ParE